jgi:ABC-type transporter Mla subunit MlaD
MGRLTALAVTCAAVAAALIWMGARGAGPEPYRFAAIFDNADFLVAGQEVKIAGASSGEVEEVHLTPNRKARVEMKVRKEFGPFHSDASCEIRPESLIGEKFVDCEPGTPRGRPLPKQNGMDTLPLEQNSSPVDLDLVFAALRLPYRQRLTILVNELGAGLAGRPAELNAAIRRANPALKRINRVLAILDRDRRTLGHLIDASDRVLAQLAGHRGEVASFIERADRVADAVASRRGDLDLALRRLPPMLEQLEPAATDLAALAADAQPVARDLRVAAKPVADLLGDFGPLTEAARPTLVALSELSRTGRRAVRSTKPVARDLLPVARRLPELVLLARQVTESLRERGGVEGLMAFFYYATAATARFDRFSHILPSYQVTGSCQQYATAPVEGCSARWGQSVARPRERGRRPQAAGGRGRETDRRVRDERPPRSAPAPQGSTPTPPAPPLPPAPPPPAAPDPRSLLDYLLQP